MLQLNIPEIRSEVMKEIKMEMDVTPDEEKDIVSMLVREELNCTTLAKNALSPLIKETWTRQSRAE